ncbi:MAG TPA: hypothetical protein VN193_11210 [Candidatus Angelobacter sp.]|nr:hypothetical protein [Candidatus Angelobacter sp.]
MPRRPLLLLAPAALILSLTVPPVQHAAAAPSPASLTVGVGGAAPGSQAFSGGPITGSADASGNAAPVTCPAPACESIPLTVAAPGGFPAKSINLSITLQFTPATGNPGGTGLDGLDIWLLDSTNSTIASATLGSSPAIASVSKIDPGNYTVEISGENGAVQETYTGTAVASVAGGAANIPSVTFSAAPLTFSPASNVSPVVLGGEPQISQERPVASPKAGAGLDPNRGFVDWPVSSRTMIGTLWRTTNGGDTYRQVVDLTCAPRQVPNCFTGGGGDTVNRVNNYDGTVNFGDQESLAQEAYASSVDHGDSFPAARQTPVTSTFAGVDRQWISTVDAPGIMNNGFELQAVFSYHIPVAGELVAAVDTSGVVHPAVPVIPSVSQSGPSRIDTQPGSHGFGYFYQGYRDGNGFEVGAAPLTSLQTPTAYTIGNVTKDQPQVFPWIALDTQGNLYALWVAPDGQLYYSFSRITDPQNDPTATPPGVPASHWSPKLKVNPGPLGSTVFPEIVAGDPGHVAIAFMGTQDWTGVSDGAPQLPNTPAKWNHYIAISQNALDSNPVFQVGLSSHRVAHLGSICTSGTTCIASQGDRSLLDMNDITMDADGRVMTVIQDNNNSFAAQELSLGSQGGAFVRVAKLATGPSLLRGHGPYAFTYPTAFRAAKAGDATWPNTAAGSNLPSLDILGSGVFADGPLLVGRIDLADSGAAAFTRDLNAFKAVTSTDVPASRLQYVVRFDYAGDSWYLAAEADSAGALTFYGGKVDATSAVSNANAAVAIAYRPQTAFPVTGIIQGNTLLIRGRMADFGVAPGSTLISYQAFSLAGPADALLAAAPETSQVFATMRDVDASPPMDAVIAGPEQQPLVPIPGGLPQTVALAGSPNTAAVAPTNGLASLAALGLLGLLGAGVRRRRQRVR